MTDDDLRRLFETLREENTAAHSETRRHVDAVAEATRNELRNHFDVVTEATRSEIRLVAESVVVLNEKVDRTAARLEDKIDKTAAETQAMIKFSHVEIDRRMRTLEESQRSLEETVADLQVRVGRLEGSTH